jgi:hypothetical protein
MDVVVPFYPRLGDSLLDVSSQIVAGVTMESREGSIDTEIALSLVTCS